VDWSSVGTGDVWMALSPWDSSASNVGGGVPGTLSLKVGRRPSSPLRSARMSSQAAESKKRTGDPSEVHGLRPLAKLGLGVVPGESFWAVGGPLILLGFASQLGGPGD